MVSSSQVGDAMRVRCDEADAVHKSAAVASVRAIRGGLVTMTGRNDHLRAIHPATQDHAGRGHSAGATDWLPQTGLRPI